MQYLVTFSIDKIENWHFSQFELFLLSNHWWFVFLPWIAVVLLFINRMCYEAIEYRISCYLNAHYAKLIMSFYTIICYILIIFCSIRYLYKIYYNLFLN